MSANIPRSWLSRATFYTARCQPKVASLNILLKEILQYCVSPFSIDELLGLHFPFSLNLVSLSLVSVCRTHVITYARVKSRENFLNDFIPQLQTCPKLAVISSTVLSLFLLYPPSTATLLAKPPPLSIPEMICMTGEGHDIVISHR